MRQQRLENPCNRLYLLSIVTLFSLLPFFATIAEAAVVPKFSAGQMDTVAINSNGTLWAWGFDFNGQLGDGRQSDQLAPELIDNQNSWLTVANGPYHSMAIKSDGTLWAWGYNDFGQLGDGSTNSSFYPEQIGGSVRWSSVSVGQYYTLAIKSDGTLWAWGSNSLGQLGDGGTTDRHSPEQIGSDNNWVSVSAGGFHAAALKSDGTLWVWGFNDYGQLGDGTLTSSYSPEMIGSARWNCVVASRYKHTVGIRSDGTLWAWGSNVDGQLGIGSSFITYQPSPAQIDSGTNWASVVAGDFHTVALKTDGSLWAWGIDFYGGTAIKLSPEQIGSDSDWIAVSAGDQHTVAMKSDGTFWVWGRNNHGQLGDGGITDQYAPEQPFSTPNGRVDGACGASNGMSLLKAPTSNLCLVGLASKVTGAGPWSWSCKGANGGATASCSAYLAEVNGVCGSSNGKGSYTMPKTNLCKSGIASTVTGTGPWSWSCQGQNGGKSSNCLAQLKVDGVCGAANKANLFTQPAPDILCGTGTASSVTGKGPWKWSCAGSNGGKKASCSANLEVNGVCGSAEGGSFPKTPTANLCSAGHASKVTGNGSWNWSCDGMNGGGSQSCSANIEVIGACGASNGKSFPAMPAANLCKSGAASSITGTGPWDWTCAGTNGGKTASCSAKLLMNGTCGSANGQNFLTAPTTGLCLSGTSSAVGGKGPWTWSCAGSNGGRNARCSANLEVNGVCGPADGQSLPKAPNSNLCSGGKASRVTGNGPWSWSCQGSNGGATVGCSADPR